MNKEDLTQIIGKVRQIALEAGEVIMDIYENDDFNVEMKSDDSPLTRADKAANKVICDYLIQITPDIPIISEENKLTSYDERKSWDLCWLVDPLDGTKEFIKRNGEFTVNVALIQDGEVVAGVVYAPALKEMYSAIKDNGAFKYLNDGEKVLEGSQFSLNDSGLRIVCSRSHLNEDTQAFLNNLNEPVTVSKGSSLKFLILASGGADIYPRLAPTMEWDTAAAQIILEEAGGSVIDNDTKQKLLYNKENLLNPYFIAYAQEQ